MSNRNYFSRPGGRNHTDPTSTSSRYNTKYHQRGGRNIRPENNRRPTGGDDIDTLMVSFDRHLPSDGRKIQETRPNQINGRRRIKSLMHSAPENSTGWWRITIQKAGNIGKDRVMSTLKTHCSRPFHAYHYFIDRNSKDGVFFVNSQQEADMLKLSNGKIQVQNMDVLRISVGRAKCPVPSIDEDVRPHFRDFLLNRRFNRQTFQLDLSNLVDDEELTTLGIFPQFNKYAFVRDVVDIINKEIHMTRQLDLGSNNIVNLHEFRNLHLDHLTQLSLASNQIKSVDDFDNLKQLPNLYHLLIKNNPINVPNRNDDITSLIQEKLPQLKRIDDSDLTPKIRFLTDIETTNLPKSNPHCVPEDMQGFLAKFIEEYYRLFDTRGRGELQACYHETCLFSLCIASTENSIVPTRSYKYGPLIYDSRNLKKIDENKRSILLRQGKTNVLDFLRIKFPLTKHDGNSFRVDVISTSNHRAIFAVNGLYRELDQGPNGPIRCFQRTFTCAHTVSGILIVADHLMINNPTESQVQNFSRPETNNAPQTTSTSNGINSESNLQQEMIHRFSQQSGMNVEYSKLCLIEHNWNYDKAGEVFQDLFKQKKIPAEAFLKK